jgi:hypothetical protein
MNKIKYFICGWGWYEFMTKDKVDGKLMMGRIRERRIRKRELDLGRGLFFRRKEKPGEEKGNINFGEEEGCKTFCGFLLVDWCCWDFGLKGQEI